MEEYTLIDIIKLATSLNKVFKEKITNPDFINQNQDYLKNEPNLSDEIIGNKYFDVEPFAQLMMTFDEKDYKKYFDSIDRFIIQRLNSENFLFTKNNTKVKENKLRELPLESLVSLQAQLDSGIKAKLTVKDLVAYLGTLTREEIYLLRVRMLNIDTHNVNPFIQLLSTLDLDSYNTAIQNLKDNNIISDTQKK